MIFYPVGQFRCWHIAGSNGDNKLLHRAGVIVNRNAVDIQKDEHTVKGGAFIAVPKRMVFCNPKTELRRLVKYRWIEVDTAECLKRRMYRWFQKSIIVYAVIDDKNLLEALIDVV